MRGLTGLLLVILAAASAGAGPMAVSAPPAGATVRGGSYATLGWAADSLPADAGEWEAFLSIDGGDHYAFRITPHLDLALRHVLWLVPNVDANDARVLIRIGDERSEDAFELPLRLAIRRDPFAPLAPLSAAPASGGEPARDGEAGVVEWVEGDRKATHLEQMRQVEPAGAMQSLRVYVNDDGMPAAAPASTRLPYRIEGHFQPPRVGHRFLAVAGPRSPIEAILLLSCRRNV